MDRTTMGQRQVARHRPVAPADQPRTREGVVGRATRAGRPQRLAVAGAAGDAVDARRLEGIGHGHGREDGGQPTGEHLPSPTGGPGASGYAGVAKLPQSSGPCRRIP